MKIFTSRISPLFYLSAACFKLHWGDFAKSAVVLTLKGIRKDDLHSLGKRFVSEFLAGIEIADSHRVLRQAQMEGDRIVLLSASIDPVVEPLGASLGAATNCTQLDYKSGLCTGQIAYEICGKKNFILRQTLDSTSEVVAVTDNEEDVDLIAAASMRYVVIRKASQRAYWSRYNPIFLSWAS